MNLALNTTRMSKDVASDDRYWFLVYTKPRQESLAQANLERQGYKTFLPLLRRQRRRRGKLESVVEPLFPRYLFVYLSATRDNWKPISSTFGVVAIVRFGSEPAKMPGDLVTTLRGQADKDGIRNEPKRTPVAGERVRIGSGLFEGYEGIFQASSGKERVTLLLGVAGCATKVELPGCDLEFAG